METSSALLAICAGNSPVPGEFPTQMPVTRSFDVFFDRRLNKRLSKQWWCWWFDTLSCPLWRHRNGYTATAATLNFYGRNSDNILSLNNKFDIMISCVKFGCFLAFRIVRGKCALLWIKLLLQMSDVYLIHVCFNHDLNASINLLILRSSMWIHHRELHVHIVTHIVLRELGHRRPIVSTDFT